MYDMVMMLWHCHEHVSMNPSIHRYIIPDLKMTSKEDMTVCKNRYRWVPLKPEFLGAWKSVWLVHYLAYLIIIISLIIQRNLATKIQAKWESSLTTVWLKWDPPVECLKFLLSHMILPYISPWDLWSKLTLLTQEWLILLVSYVASMISLWRSFEIFMILSYQYCHEFFSYIGP